MEEFCIIAFDNTHHAIACEKRLLEKGLHIRMIPVPREVTANCGLSIRFEPEDYDAVRLLVTEFSPISFYKVKKTVIKKEVTPMT